MSFFTSLLAQYGIGLLKEGYQIGLDWLGQFARVIIEGVGVIGAGIIVFTLVLKAITLPFDIYQRVKMRKQTLLMRQMQPDLEKLQQQYKDDKNMYNQKMMELYKKNGYSMLGACLPMIISLIILIVAFQGFRTYSNYANLQMYVNMSHEYNVAVLEHSEEGKEYRLPEKAPEGYEYIINWSETPVTDPSEPVETTVNGVTVITTTRTTDIIHTEEEIIYTYRTIVIETKTGADEAVSVTRKSLFVQSAKADKFIYYSYPLDADEYTRSYYVDSDRLKATVGETYNEYVNSAKEAYPFNTEGTETEENYNKRIDELANKDYVRYIGASAAAEWYRENGAHFFWVKNVWYPDVSYQHPIQNYKGFSGSFKGVKVTYPDGTKKDLLNEMNKSSYEDLVSELTAETKTPNGYFILIILSIGLMVLSQFISMRSNKESNKYQTVDGSGAKTQKMMLIMMPLIYAIFAFMYSAAFSIYMVISSAVAILVTLLSNLILGAVFKNKEKKLEEQRTVRRLPWMKDDADKDKKRKNNGKRG